MVNPDLRTVTIYRADGTITLFFEDQMLTGETVLPSFSAKVADLMPQSPSVLSES